MLTHMLGAFILALIYCALWHGQTARRGKRKRGDDQPGTDLANVLLTRPLGRKQWKR